MLILIVPRIPNLMMSRQGKGRRIAAPRILIISGMITNLAVARDPGRVTVEEVSVHDSMVIWADIMVKIVKTTRVVTTNSSNYQVTRATQSS